MSKDDFQSLNRHAKNIRNCHKHRYLTCCMYGTDILRGLKYQFWKEKQLFGSFNGTLENGEAVKFKYQGVLNVLYD